MKYPIDAVAVECKDCKNHESIENISLREEIEQDLINRSVSVDLSKRITSASLPFIYDPTIKLCNNKDVALRIYYQQLRKLNKNPEDMSDILNAEAKLQKLQFVEFVKKSIIS